MKHKKTSLVLIPSRYASSRFPAKPLALIQGKSLIQRVWENLNQSPELDAWVVTDHPEIEAAVKAFGGQVVRVDDEVSTGTERIGLAYNRFFADKNYQFVVNVQGDEPLLRAYLVEQLTQFHVRSDFDIATIVKRRNTSQYFDNPNWVKVAFTPENGQCHYFSRAQIPFPRENNLAYWFHHMGVYCYRPQALQTFCSAKASYLERMELLEQLRALELGMKLGAIETSDELMGVDTPEDIARVEGVLLGTSNKK